MKRKPGVNTICPVCDNPVDKCICCTECSHVCPLDWGETYCPVCSPVIQEEKVKKVKT